MAVTRSNSPNTVPRRHVDRYQRIIAVHILPKSMAPLGGMWAGATPPRVSLTVRVRKDRSAFPGRCTTASCKVMKQKYEVLKAAAEAGKKVGGGKLERRGAILVKTFELEDEIEISDAPTKEDD